jgi:hypothetical protein
MILRNQKTLKYQTTHYYRLIQKIQRSQMFHLYQEHL